MHRQYPETNMYDNGATTTVWPRSRTNTPRRRAIVRNSKNQKNPLIRGPKRPILRPVLVQALKERMRNLAQRTFQWTT